MSNVKKGQYNFSSNINRS